MPCVRVHIRLTSIQFSTRNSTRNTRNYCLLYSSIIHNSISFLDPNCMAFSAKNASCRLMRCLNAEFLLLQAFHQLPWRRRVSILLPATAVGFVLMPRHGRVFLTRHFRYVGLLHVVPGLEVSLESTVHSNLDIVHARVRVMGASTSPAEQPQTCSQDPTNWKTVRSFVLVETQCSVAQTRPALHGINEVNMKSKRRRAFSFSQLERKNCILIAVAANAPNRGAFTWRRRSLSRPLAKKNTDEILRDQYARLLFT